MIMGIYGSPIWYLTLNSLTATQWNPVPLTLNPNSKYSQSIRTWDNLILEGGGGVNTRGKKQRSTFWAPGTYGNDRVKNMVLHCLESMASGIG